MSLSDTQWRALVDAVDDPLGMEDPERPGWTWPGARMPTLRALERRGLLEVEIDGNIWRVRPTARGRAHVERVQSIRAKWGDRR